MTELTLLDGGSRTLDLTKAVLVRTPADQVSHQDKVRESAVELYLDDKQAQTRTVLQVTCTSTLKGRKPRSRASRATLTTIYGYDPDKNMWGPESRTSKTLLTWANAKRLIDAVRDLADREFEPHKGDVYARYRRKS